MARRSKQTSSASLTPFEGYDVLQVGIEITKAGDGLSDAMAVDPAEFHVGDTLHVVLECHLTKIRYEQINGVDALRRVHRLEAGTATIVDASLVADVLEAQRLAIEQAQGVTRLDFTGDDE
jgi:hypothetical protein